MGQQDTFSIAFDLYRQVMVHATGNSAKVLAVSIAASVVFVAACVGCGMRKVLSNEE